MNNHIGPAFRTLITATMLGKSHVWGVRMMRERYIPLSLAH